MSTERELQTMTRAQIEEQANPPKKPRRTQWEWLPVVPPEVPTDGEGGDPLLFSDQVAAMAGIDPHTWRKYVTTGTAPKPDDEDLDRPAARRMRRWRKSRIEHWMANRIGQGRRTDVQRAAGRGEAAGE